MTVFEVLLVSALCATLAHAHGRLMVPTTRKPTGYENDPVGYNSESFVCRNNPTSPATTVQAGEALEFRWAFSAAHVGDCAVYVSYDVHSRGAMMDSKFFKIGNIPKCKDLNNTPVNLVMPSWLPAGRAVIRWDWYALHQSPSSVEFYAQCADVNIVSNSARTPAEIPSYPIISPPVYPLKHSEGVGYRNPFAPNTEQFMTGPPCAFDDMTVNNCGLTARGTTGSVDVSTLTTGGGDDTPAPEDGGGDDQNNNGGNATPAPTVSVVNCVTSYTVLAGDTLTSIAFYQTANGPRAMTAQDICDLNDLSDCNFISVGQVLQLPHACAGGGNVNNLGNSSGAPDLRGAWTLLGLLLALCLA